MSVAGFPMPEIIAQSPRARQETATRENVSRPPGRAGAVSPPSERLRTDIHHLIVGWQPSQSDA